MTNNDYIKRAINYKKYIGSRYIALEQGSISKKISHFKEFLVSIKYDGHFYALFYSDNNITMINRSGKIIKRIGLHDEMENHFKSLGIKQLFIAGELYVSSDVRTRMFNVTSDIASGGQNLKFAAFDLIELDEDIFETKNVFEKYQKLEEIIPKDGNFHIVEYMTTQNVKEIEEYFKEKVEIGKSEGLVIKTEGYPIFKIKPKFTFDAVIVGFANGDGERSELLRDFLLAFRKDDGSYQIFAHLSHGFSDEERKELLIEYKKKIVDSDYIEVARNRLGFQMIKPDTVIEFSCIDVINSDSKGDILKMNLNYDDKNGYKANYNQPSVSVTIPLFIKFREDKQATVEETNFSQVLDVVSYDDIKTIDLSKLPNSEIIRREVYRKESRGSIMVRKFIILKTNKEGLDNYPAYVWHYTDFSTGRKDPLKTDVIVSDNKEQIEKIYDESIVKNIKKGWEKVEE